MVIVLPADLKNMYIEFSLFSISCYNFGLSSVLVGGNIEQTLAYVRGGVVCLYNVIGFCF